MSRKAKAKTRRVVRRRRAVRKGVLHLGIVLYGKDYDPAKHGTPC